MNKILIVSLGTSKQLLSSAHLMDTLRANYPHTELHLLIDESHRSYAPLLNHVSKFHMIQTEKIKKIVDGRLFSNGYALETLGENLAEVMNENWDQVINQSNTTLSTLMTTVMLTENKIGVSLSDKGTTKHSCDWSLTMNYVNSSARRSPIESNIIQSNLIGAPWRSASEPLKISDEYSQIANQNFGRIRTMKAGDSKVIGISLSQGYDGSYLSKETLSEVIGTLRESTQYIPVLLIDSKQPSQKNMVNELNLDFNNSLISINIDLTAFTAVARNLDLFVSPATDQLVLANLMQTESIELRNAEPFAVEPIVSTEHSRVLYFTEEKQLGSDIIFSINELFESEMPVETMVTKNKSFACVKDEYGYFFSQIRGDVDLHSELNYHISRSIFFNLLGYPENQHLFKDIQEKCQKDHLKEYVNIVRSDLTGVVKILLATLRALKGMRNSQDSLNSFLGYYDQLLAYGTQDSIVGALIRFAEGRVEAIETDDAKENFVQIEKELFELKSNVQRVTEVCGYLMGDLTPDSKSTDKTA